jgi:hypothetical protein
MPGFGSYAESPDNNLAELIRIIAPISGLTIPLCKFLASFANKAYYSWTSWLRRDVVRGPPQQFFLSQSSVLWISKKQTEFIKQ